MSSGIYIHIPFCIAKCAYCDFNSYAGKLALSDAYVDRLISEMREKRGIKADTVYIGGGTPTVLETEQLTKILSAVNECFEIESDAEITVESNPATADISKYKVLKDYGVNRLSIGVQSFFDNELSALSRVHNAYQAERTISDAQEAGIGNMSIDLMEGIPLQTLDTLERSINKAIAFDIKHISVYSLIIEEGTPFYKNTPELPSEDEEREMCHMTERCLSENGFCHYEISNYAKPGYSSRHNTKYWTREPYYGFGAGAHSFYGNVRYENVKKIEDYINLKSPVAESIFINEAEAERERFMLGFRLLDGFYTNGEFEDKLKKLNDEGLIILENGRARLTKRGTDLANQVFMEFVGED